MQQKKLNVNFGKAGFILLAVFAALLAADLITKACAEAYRWQFTVIPGLIEVVPVRRNTGAAFSFLADAEWGQSFLIAVTVVMIAALIAVFLFLPRRMIVMKVAVTLVLAGAFGNLVDRCMYLGEDIAARGVRDFVDVNMLVEWACCNFADFWIVFGVIIAVADILFFNDWALLPLTARAKEAQRLRGEKTQPSDNPSSELPAEAGDGEEAEADSPAGEE